MGIPLQGDGYRNLGYLEVFFRFDENWLHAQRDHATRIALIAMLAVAVTALSLYPLLIGLTKRSSRVAQALLDSQLSLLLSLGNAVAKRDSDTEAHSYRVTLYAAALGEAMGWGLLDIANLIAGALLHDIGKIGIPDVILRKPSALTGKEFDIMKKHPMLGAEIVASNQWLAAASKVIRHHHEHYDGSGYPDGLIGESIPINARVFAVVDAFDAITSPRPYKDAGSVESALTILRANRGSQFDPRVTDIFCALAPGLYNEIGDDDIQNLHVRLDKSLSRYFSTSLSYTNYDAS